MINRLCVVGAGSWGTALSIALSSRFAEVALWSRDPGQAAEIQRARENARYLPGFVLPGNVAASSDSAIAFKRAEVVLAAIPSQVLRCTLVPMRQHVEPSALLVTATKGLETESLQRMSEVMAQALGKSEAAVLSGPTFAREIAAGEPAAVVIAATRLAMAEQIQHLFSTPSLRFYASSDPIGVEMGAALKNVIAIGAGICSGLGLGSNSVAALVTRGLAEITRLAVKMGGHPRTLSGLAGLGDLVLTATGDLSRNRRVGLELGRGRRLEDILQNLSMVAEGVSTCRAARDLGRREKVDLPIIEQMFAVLYQAKEPRSAIRDLMERPLTIE